MRATTTSNAPVTDLEVWRGCSRQSRGRLRKVHTGYVQGFLLLIVRRQLGWLALFLQLLAIYFRFVTVLGFELSSASLLFADLGAIIFIVVVRLFGAALRLITHSCKACI